ncbi:MAG: NADH-quinone oxidoreductase subunit N [Deltaproteobacteria bacterium]|nr:NADH-quinone oxidoreductase subunit N [Deltaproteobacteria bacterium]
MFEQLMQDSLLALPILGWAGLGILLVCLQIFCPRPKISLIASVIGLVALISYSTVNFVSVPTAIFFGTAVIDANAQFFNLLGLIIALFTVLTMIPGMNNEHSKVFRLSYEQFPEFLICLLFSGFGLGVLASAIDLTSLFLGLETLSIGIYCLCGFYRTEIRSTESAFKYLMIGAFSTAIFLYGIAFIYGASGATHYSVILETFKTGVSPLASLGILFLLAGFAFKLAFVPFHLYTADVYEGAPTPVTGFMATIVKVGVIAAALRIFWGFLQPAFHFWEPFWVALCLVSILVGNIAALQQRSIKKLLAFSSISHGGFLGLGLLVANPEGGNLFPLAAYITIYSAMSLGVFALISHLENREHIFSVEDLRGLGNKKFFLSLIFALFVLGLAGIPPFAGFMIKFWILQALVQQNYMTVALIAVVGSIIGAAYYLRILMLMFMSTEEGAAAQWPLSKDRALSLRFVVAVTALITLLGGIRPSLYADWILHALALK